MGDGSYLCFVRHTEIHAPVRRRHCIIHFQQSVRFVAVYLRDQRRGLSARHYRVNDSRSSRCRRIYPDSIGTRLIDGTWYVCDYVVVFLLDTRCRQMERIHKPNSVEPHRGILVQRCRPSLCLYRVVFGITAKESRPSSVELMSRCWRGDSCLSNWARAYATRPRRRGDRIDHSAAKRHFCCAAYVRSWHFATHSAAIKSRPLWRRTGNERTHGLSHLDAICLALDLTVPNVVHPSTVHRQHLRRNPT